MNPERQVLQNRRGKNLVALVERTNKSKGIVFLMHGLGWYKEEPLIQRIAGYLYANGYTVVRFDATNSFGESDGMFEDATITNQYEDLEDVVNWAGDQSWYSEPFSLAGQSVGGLCSLYFTYNFPDKITALSLFSTVISGDLTLETCSKEFLDDWKTKGYFSWEDDNKLKKLKWAFMEDAMQYDMLEIAPQVRAPVLMMVGDRDTQTPVTHQKRLYDRLQCPKRLHIIEGAGHTFTEEHLIKASEYYGSWIKDL